MVVSLWSVNDIATAELMKVFYQNLKRGLTTDKALREAKLQLLKGKQQTWHHPYFWASFVLVRSPIRGVRRASQRLGLFPIVALPHVGLRIHCFT